MAQLSIRTAPLRFRLGRAVYFWVLVGIAAGVMIGAVSPATGEAMKPLGDGFIKLVKMVIAPVVFLTITTGIGGMAIKSVGRVATSRAAAAARPSSEASSRAASAMP